MKKTEKWTLLLLLAGHAVGLLFRQDGSYRQMIGDIILLISAILSLYFALCYKKGWRGREGTEQYRSWLLIGLLSLQSGLTGILQSLGFLTMTALTSAICLLFVGVLAFWAFKSKWAVIFLIIPVTLLILIVRDLLIA
ncbi:MAG: hypothetical protein IJ411_01425 [Oscillospiraceae bacterium]|nr:hypothetical protein [Oscillospiraceae bacterium]